jgi:hypothetical protein
MERRAHQRVLVQMTAEVEISVSMGGRGKDQGAGDEFFKGVVETVDLSLCGLSVRIIGSNMDTGLSFSPALASRLVGKEIMTSFCSSSLTVWGKVVRFDPRNMLFAVVITRVSDIMRWKELCSEAIFAEAVK